MSVNAEMLGGYPLCDRCQLKVQSHNIAMYTRYDVFPTASS